MFVWLDMMSPDSDVVQAAPRLCSCIPATIEQFFFRSVSSNIVPGVISEIFIIKDLPREKLTAHSALWAGLKTRFFLLQGDHTLSRKKWSENQLTVELDA